MSDSLQELESRRLRLQTELDAARTQAERNRMGQFATPPALADDVVRAAVALLPPAAPVRFLDPAFGTGSFFSALLRIVPPTRLASATGYEIDRHYGQPAQRLWTGTPLALHLADFTRAAPDRSSSSRPNLVVCNPPYVRHHHLSPAEKARLQRSAANTCGIEPGGLSGLYCYFLCLSHSWMDDSGIAAWLIPSEFMDVNYGDRIKQYLLNRVTLLQVHRFDPAEVQFDDALVSSAVVLFRKASPPTDHQVEFTFGGSLSRPTVREHVPAPTLRDSRKWTAFPGRSRANGDPLAAGTLADLLMPKRGIATGCNEFFILTPERAAELELPTQFLTPILPSPRLLDTDELAAAPDGDPLITHRRYLLSCDLPPHDIRSRYPALWRYLQSGEQSGVSERYLSRHRQPWYAQEHRDPAPFLCTYMGRTGARTNPFRFILNWSRATAPNVYLMLYPRPALATILKSDPEAARAVWRALASLAPEVLVGEGRIYGGGLHKLEPRELANVPATVVLDALPRRLRPARQRSLFGT